jgi:anaerobic ribonucleoside-triphosphate reductase activating protein
MGTQERAMRLNYLDHLYEPDVLNSGETLNVAATCPVTRALGPGLRAVVWVQGCFFRCPGCIAPGWIPIQPARLTGIEDLASELLSHPDVTGLTFSGGEPMLQAAGLARLARLIRSKRDVDIVCFTGFMLSHLQHTPPGPGVMDLMYKFDVLIDGPYIEKLNDNRGLRGSCNQRIHFLTDRLKGCDFESEPRKAEIQLGDEQMMLVGIPPVDLEEAIQHAFRNAGNSAGRLVQYERI